MDQAVEVLASCMTASRYENGPKPDDYCGRLVNESLKKSSLIFFISSEKFENLTAWSAPLFMIAKRLVHINSPVSWAIARVERAGGRSAKDSSGYTLLSGAEDRCEQ